MAFVQPDGSPNGRLGDLGQTWEERQREFVQDEAVSKWEQLQQLLACEAGVAGTTFGGQMLTFVLAVQYGMVDNSPAGMVEVLVENGRARGDRTPEWQNLIETARRLDDQDAIRLACSDYYASQYPNAARSGEELIGQAVQYAGGGDSPPPPPQEPEPTEPPPVPTITDAMREGYYDYVCADVQPAAAAQLVARDHYAQETGVEPGADDWYDRVLAHYGLEPAARGTNRDPLLRMANAVLQASPDRGCAPPEPEPEVIGRDDDDDGNGGEGTPSGGGNGGNGGGSGPSTDGPLGMTRAQMFGSAVGIGLFLAYLRRRTA